MNMIKIKPLARQLSQILIKKQCILATAESCTGGWVAQVLTSLPGSSAWFERGFVTYSNAAKEEMLGVDPVLIQKYGAVSCEVAEAMAQGALQFSHANLSLAITGIAGPGGGTVTKPVGTVCFAWAGKTVGIHSEQIHLKGDRATIRRQAVSYALNYLIDLLSSK